MPVPCAFFFSAEFFFCALHRMPGGCCRERDDGNSAPAAKAPEPRVGSPGQSPGQKSGSEVRGRAAKAGCRSRVPRAASDCRKQGPEGVFCTAGSDVPPAKAPHAAPGFGKSAGRPAAGPAVPGPGSGSAAGSVDGSGSCGCFRGPGAAADSGAGFRESRRVSCSAAVPKAGFRGPGPGFADGSGGMRRKAFSGLGPGVPKAFRLRRIFPRTEAFSAVHERRRGNPRSAFPSGGGPGSAGSRVPGAGSGCGRFLRRPHPAAENRGNPASPVKKETFQTGFVEEL